MNKLAKNRTDPLYKKRGCKHIPLVCYATSSTKKNKREKKPSKSSYDCIENQDVFTQDAE
ncbi:hypothetical protein FRX31_012751, partial [Thalictrum thalictroides]